MNQRPPRVGIVGGGLAGMSAALALRGQAADLDITVYESKRLTGGRAGSFTDPQTGEPIDYCQHVAMGCCVNLIAMMKSVGLNDAWTRHRELRFFHPDHPPARFGKSRLLPAPLHLLPSLIRLPYLSWPQKLEIARATWALLRTPRESLLATTAYDWLVSQHQSPLTIRDYWQVVITSALGESCESVSMAAARKVFIDGFLASHEASDVLVPQRPLAELFGVALPRAIASQNVRFRDATRVRAVTPGTEGGMTLQLADEEAVCDHVILAVPCQTIAKLISPSTALAAGLPADRFADIPCSPISGIHLWFDRPVLDRPHAVLVGTLAQWAFSADSLAPRADG
ncbi:MAG: hydroxysqualene dehydroxylase HpnE, partial [Planctomycetaceae bacterium]